MYMDSVVVQDVQGETKSDGSRAERALLLDSDSARSRERDTENSVEIADDGSAQSCKT